MVEGKPETDQYAIDLTALLLSAAEPHKQLLELLETNEWSKGSVVEWLQAESQKSTSDSIHRRKCVKCLNAIVKRYHVFPSTFFIKDISLDGLRPKKRGGFADIYKGTIGTRMVCLKLLRTYSDWEESKRNTIISDFCKEALIWTQLSHPNILPLLGVNTDLFEPEFCLVSPWMVNDDIVSFLKRNHDHDRLQPIYDIAAGLEYLHSLSPVIVHGDIKGGNILVDENHNCLLSDFGLSQTISQTTGTTSTGSGGSVRWMAPELFNYDEESEERQYKPPRDIYAFGCTIFEIMTEKLPFPELPDVAVIHQVVNSHTRPARPTDARWCPDDIWSLVTLCWHEDPPQRPEARAISAYLNGRKEETETGQALLLRYLIPENLPGTTGSINFLMTMGFSRYEVHRLMHKYRNNIKHVLPILMRAARDAMEQSEVLLYTSIAATTLDERCQINVYYQNSSGQIVEEVRRDTLEAKAIFRAALFTPLAVINYNHGEEIRVYYLDQDSILQEYCCSGDGQWYFSKLGDLKIKAAYDTSLAAVCWNDNNITHIRVFYQEFDSNSIMAAVGETGSWHKDNMIISGALRGTSLSTVKLWYDEGIYIRMYYQDANLVIREHCYDSHIASWYLGDFKPLQTPQYTPIAVTCQFRDNLRVWWRNDRGEIVGSGFYNGRGWISLNTILASSKPGTNFAVVDISWASDHNQGKPLTRAYYQNVVEGENEGHFFSEIKGS